MKKYRIIEGSIADITIQVVGLMSYIFLVVMVITMIYVIGGKI